MTIVVDLSMLILGEIMLLPSGINADF